MDQALVNTFQHLALQTLYGDTPDLEELVETNSAASFFLLLLIIKVLKRYAVHPTHPYRATLDYIDQITRQQFYRIPEHHRHQDLAFFITHGPHPPAFEHVIALISSWNTPAA